MTLTTDESATPDAENELGAQEIAASPETKNDSNATGGDVPAPVIEKKRIDPSSKIAFPNGNTAQLIAVSPGTSPDNFLERLGLSFPKALIVMAGSTKGFDGYLKSRVYQFSRGIDRAACDIDALIIDSGVGGEGMAIMEEAVAYRRYRAPLIGILPAEETDSHEEIREKVSLDPDHTHFILVETSEPGEYMDLMYRFVQRLTKADDIPAITVLVNGGKSACAQTLRGVRMGSPVIVFKGSGGLADEIAELHENPPDFIEDVELAEIVREGEIHIFPMEASINALERLISRQVRMDSILKQAWNLFGVYDLNAIRHQRTFQKIQNAIIWLGVLATALALIQKTVDYKAFNEIFRYFIIAIPVMVAILFAAANEFKSGNKWILLRGSAELIKSHIFRYRTRTETYAETEVAGETGFAERLEQISTRLIQTEVNLSELKPYTGPLPPLYGTKPGDDGFSRLSPEKYLETRLEDQLAFYIGKTAKVEKRLRLLQWLVYIVGGLGTMLAAFKLELWVALTGALVAAFGTHIKYEMLQESLTKYNQAAVALTNVRNWWISMSAAEQAKKSNINVLVENTEGILRSEFSSWVQEMQDTIASLQKKEMENENEDQQPPENISPKKEKN